MGHIVILSLWGSMELELPHGQLGPKSTGVRLSDLGLTGKNSTIENLSRVSILPHSRAYRGIRFHHIPSVCSS
jgi:hypothetical protein